MEERLQKSLQLYLTYMKFSFVHSQPCSLCYILKGYVLFNVTSFWKVTVKTYCKLVFMFKEKCILRSLVWSLTEHCGDMYVYFVKRGTKSEWDKNSLSDQEQEPQIYRYSPWKYKRLMHVLNFSHVRSLIELNKSAHVSKAKLLCKRLQDQGLCFLNVTDITFNSFPPFFKQVGNVFISRFCKLSWQPTDVPIVWA